MTEPNPDVLGEPIKRSARLTGEPRDRLRETVTRLYTDGADIRSIATATGRSYGSVHRLLRESGVVIRRRGEPGTPAKALQRRELAALIRKKYEAGASSYDLATPEVGSRHRVIRLLVEAGTELRKGGRMSRADRARCELMREGRQRGL